MGGSRKGVIRQLTGSFLSFAFIWQWHGGHLYALWWFIPNWLGVVVESAAGKVLAQPSVRRMEVGVRDRSLFIVRGGGARYFGGGDHSTFRRTKGGISRN